MKRFIIPGTLLIIFVLSFSRCYYDSEEYLYPSLNTSCDTSGVVTYSGTITNILSQNCYSCHSNSNAAAYGRNVKLENYADVKSRVDDGSLYGSIIHDPKYIPMPYNGGTINSCSILLLKKWIDAQAPNN